MPVFTINVGTISANPVAVADALKIIALHAAAMGYAISAPAIGTGGNAGKLQITITAPTALTAAQLTHLGLV